MPALAEHCPVSAKAGSSHAKTRAELGRAAADLLPSRMTFPAAPRPLQALPGSCHQTSPSLWHNGLRLLPQVVREPERGSRTRARCCLGVWAPVYNMRSRVGRQTTFPTTPLCKSGPLAKCPLQRVLRGRSELVGHRRLTSDGGTRRKRLVYKAALTLTHPT